MKQAKMHIPVVEFTCPECNESISEEETGSHLFLTYQVPLKLRCHVCEIYLQVPAKARKLD